MLHVLPVEISLTVISYLPLSTLCRLSTLSRDWFDFFSENQSTIFHKAAILHGYIDPETLLLEDALSMRKGSPWKGAADWKDFCRRCLQLHNNWEGNGRVVARLLNPPAVDVHRLKVDEKAGILITTHIYGGLTVNHLFSGVLLWSLSQSYVRRRAHCEYENGYLVFDCFDGRKEVWRLESDCAPAVGEEAAAIHAPPDEQQRREHAFSSAVHGRYAPRGHFRPWAKLSFPTTTRAYRLAYPTLLCAGRDGAFLHDVRTGALVQTVAFDGLEVICYVDVNERYVFVCETEALHVFSRGDGGAEVLRIPRGVSFSKAVGPSSTLTDRQSFVSVLPLLPVHDEHPSEYIAAHVSRDGRDLVIMTTNKHVLLIRDFERVCRGDASLENSGLFLQLSEEAAGCSYLAFEHGRVCVATSIGLHIFAVDGGQSDSTGLGKVVFVQPFAGPAIPSVSCMQLTDRRVYFTWDNARRRNIPLFRDEECTLDVSSPGVEQLDEIDEISVGVSVGCIDFSLMPES